MLRLVQLIQNGELRSSVDDGSGYASGPFHGLESVESAVEVSNITFLDSLLAFILDVT